jgi:hypothetical protein
MKGKYVYTSAKAADARHLAGFTLVLMTESQRPGCEVRNMIFSIAWGLANYYENEYRFPKYLSDVQIMALIEPIQITLINLSAVAELLDSKLFHCKPKDHQILHLVELWCVATHLNPRFSGNYKNENFVKQIKRMVRVVDKRALTNRVVEHFLLNTALLWKELP